MKQLFYSKLTKRYLFITLVVILIALSSLYALTIHVMNTPFQSQIEYRDELITRTLSQRINFVLNKIVNDMRFFSPYLLKEQESDKQFYLSEMQRLVGQDSHYLAILAFDDQGKRLASIPTIQYEQHLDVHSILDVLSWSKTFDISHAFSLESGNPAIAVSYPALDEQGRFRGMIIALTNLGTFSQYLEELKIGENGVNFIVDTDGTIIAHSNRQLIGNSIKDHVLTQYIRKERYGLWVGELFGEEMIVSYRPLSLGRFGLIVAEPLKQANAPSRHVSILLLEGFIAVLLISAFLSIAGTSRVVKPILLLIRQAIEYKENKRKRFSPIQTNDELEQLSLVMGQMAKELTDKERRLFYILESIPYGVMTIDKSGRIMTFNKGAEELTLYSREEVIGQFIFQLPFKENKEEFIAWKTLQEGKAFNDLESYIYDKHLRKHEVRLYSSLLYGGEENVMGSILVIRDISEMKKLEEYVKQKERLASLGKLMAGIAHEIKNPLSIIQAAAEAIDFEVENRRMAGPMVHEFTQDIYAATERMNRLLSDFLNLSKGDQKWDKEPLDLLAVIEELLHLLRKNLNDLSIKVHREIQVDQAMVFGNKGRLTQVFLNILLNSIQAMEGRGGQLTIRLSASDEEWDIEIGDTGKGIPAAKVRSIFHPFYTTRQDGTGLGLSISHEIISQHGGRIWAESEESKGTTLFIRLPRRVKGESNHEEHFASG